MRKFCLAVCTFGRVEQLVTCLELSVAQLGAFSEVIIIDNNNPSKPEVAAIAARFNFKLIHEPKTGLSAARNRALKESSAEYVWFIDDDASLKPGFAEALRILCELKVFPNTPQDFGGGLIIPEFQDEKARRKLGKLEMALLSCNESAYGFQPWGANMFVNRIAALACGGFAEDYGYVGNSMAVLGEEDELFMRLNQTYGARPFFIENAAVGHWIPNLRLRLNWQMKRAYRGGFSNFRVYRDRSIQLIFRKLARLVLIPSRENLLNLAFECGKFHKSNLDSK